MSSSRKASSATISWRDVEPGPMILVHGSEEYLHSRVTDLIKTKLKTSDPNTEIHHMSASDYESGQLQVLTSPSLFGEAILLIIDNMHRMTDPLLADGLEYIANPNPDVTLLCLHGGGTRGKRLLDGLKKTGQFVEAKPIKSERERLEFLRFEFRLARRRIQDDAIRSLSDAIGSDLGELAAAAAQLVSDTDGEISEAEVEKYYGGRIQATAFKVADAALDGQLAMAVALLRHAFATGVQPVAVSASFAFKTRQIARVLDTTSTSGQLASALGMAPWQVQRVATTARQWSQVNIAGAIELVARADAEAKGLSREPQFAIERMVTKIAMLAKQK